MPELDGIEATRKICSGPALSNVRVLSLTTFDPDEYVYTALRAGRRALPAEGHPCRPRSSPPSASWLRATHCSRPRCPDA